MNEGPVHESRALGINRRSRENLAPSGVTHRLLAIGKRVKGLELRTKERQLFQLDVPGAGDSIPLILVVPQSDIESAMVEALRQFGMEVEWRVELVAVRHPEQTPSIELRRPEGIEIVTPDLLIGADGAHSTVRHQLGIDFPGSAYETEWGLADARVRTVLPLDQVHAFDLAPILFALIPIRENLVRFVSDHPDVLSHVPPQIEVLSVEWESLFRISHRQAKTYQRGNVFLAGDAAHIHSPIGARGMNLGIEDAAWLAWLIAEGGTDRYTAERHPVGRRVLKTVDPATRLISSDAFLPKLARRHILPLLVSFAPMRRLMVDRIAGLSSPTPPWLVDEPK
jgi:2-polyprenyl-6-methoxyphenol hydroxylase-like FAD-dependent oxidoreductase